MTADDPDEARPKDLREQAAEWFAQRREPQTAQEETDFVAWMAADPLHREAYSRISEAFSLGKGLRDGTADTGPPAPPRRPYRVTLIGAVLVMAIASALPMSAWLQGGKEAKTQVTASTTAMPPATQTTTLLTRTGQIRSWRLSDGSAVTLDTGSRVAVDMTETRRTLRLLAGRARFDVAHETRPFVVAADGGEVTAHGTLFDVDLKANRSVSVRLLRGVVDVEVADTRPLRARLAPGQQLLFLAGAMTAPVPAATVDARWPQALLDCDSERLSEVADAANRYTRRRIVFADSKIAALRVSGSFRIDRADALVDRLASLFDLVVDRSDPAQLVLRSRQTQA